MRVSIGGNLRRLRHQKGLTQEQVAEVFGLSAQAISRWENDSAYPDVTMLPGLAMYYGVSVDEIVGMEHIRREERLHGFMNAIYRAAAAGELDQAVCLAREGLRDYPDDSGLLMALGETLARKADDADSLREAIRVAERALAGNGIRMKARSTTMVNLIFLYVRAGMSDKANALIRELPHIWESREMVAPETCAEDAEYRAALKRSILEALTFLCGKIDAEKERKAGETPRYVQLGVDFGSGMGAAGMIEKIREFLDA